ncbi:hypothetical protein OU997_16490 [Pseudomonas sp. SL4(2022)]|uniref:hypothetical protein n=1 Tax=Pseudomonas sp. SL4(2022) TaxID=2994661 RepID=UPI002270BE0A|nr:hypothetical protein [Pseudomonas sp. SL4(2022)]WAC43833.1 hypothetical protein OU997_16490 [Pseudomonas sp. SL4(2022)]
MSRQGMNAALQHAQELPAFQSINQAQESLFKLKDATLSAFIAELGTALNLDFTPESLKALEKWFIESGSPEIGAGSYSIPHAIGFYYGEILCRSAGFTWVVEEFPFQKGRYSVGIARPLLKIMLTRGLQPKTEGNKRMQSLYRECKSYAL